MWCFVYNNGNIGLGYKTVPLAYIPIYLYTYIPVVYMLGFVNALM